MSEPYAHDAPGPHLIRNGRLEADSARPFVPDPEVAADGQVPTDEPGWIVPLATWKASHATLRRHRHPVAVLLEPDADLRDLLEADGTLDPAGIAFIAVDFPVYTDGRGISTYYAGWTVAGYPVPTATLGFVYPVLEGKLLRDDSLAVMCSGMYEIQNIGDVNAVMDDLTTKLSALYGSYTHGSFNTRVWTDANGHSITLWPTDTSVYLLYYHADRDALMNAAVQAIADERAEQEELLRIQNQNNTDGL